MTEPMNFLTVYLGMGGNMGHPMALFDESVDQLRNHHNCLALRESHRYESEPIDATGPNYVNSVIEMKWNGDPQTLLNVCLEIEADLGRVRSVRNAPRPMDLDVLLFGNQIIEQPDLSVPHPRMHQRRFVLQPLLDLWPEAEIPGIGPARQSLQSCMSQMVRRI
jgi:2-amino-4-hydroxy-6-hydroxymethyldihydropteridine diphosphokinase